jgi:hypothetical protein
VLGALAAAAGLDLRLDVLRVVDRGFLVVHLTLDGSVA